MSVPCHRECVLVTPHEGGCESLASLARKREREAQCRDDGGAGYDGGISCQEPRGHAGPHRMEWE